MIDDSGSGSGPGWVWASSVSHSSVSLGLTPDIIGCTPRSQPITAAAHPCIVRSGPIRKQDSIQEAGGMPLTPADIYASFERKL